MHDRIFCQGDCCRCVPNLLCVTFTPDTPTETCIAVYSLFGTELNDSGVYSGVLRNIVGKGIITEIDIAVVKIDDVCYWRVFIDDFDIEELFEIDGDTVTCREPSLDVVIGGDCPGTIHIEPHNLEKVPFVKKEVAEITEVAFTCGACDALCTVICVQYTFDDELVRREFIWEPLNSRWENGDDHITPSTDGSQCELAIDIEDINPVSSVLIDACGVGTEAEPGLLFENDTIKISCNYCSCWQYICDKCRCACDVICLVLQSGFGVPTFHELAWDGVNSRWGDDTYSIGISENPETGLCQLSVPGFDPFDIDSCGIDVNFSLEDDDGNRAMGRCKNCHCFTLPAECCGTSIYELPYYLVATVEGVSGCTCFSATIYLLYDPTGTQWCGTAQGGCPDTRISVCVTCAPGTTCPVGLTVDVCCNALHPTPGPITCGFASSFTQDSCSCPPLLLVLDDIVIDRSCCDNEPMAGGTIKITITE